MHGVGNTGVSGVAATPPRPSPSCALGAARSSPGHPPDRCLALEQPHANGRNPAPCCPLAQAGGARCYMPALPRESGTCEGSGGEGWSEANSIQTVERVRGVAQSGPGKNERNTDGVRCVRRAWRARPQPSRLAAGAPPAAAAQAHCCARLSHGVRRPACVGTGRRVSCRPARRLYSAVKLGLRASTRSFCRRLA